LVACRVGNDRSGKHTSRDENCGAVRYR
jgi:hypothetical protein